MVSQLVEDEGPVSQEKGQEIGLSFLNLLRQETQGFVIVIQGFNWKTFGIFDISDLSQSLSFCPTLSVKIYL